MSSKLFKVSAVAVTVFTALNANAALYQVVEVDPEGISAGEYNEVHGVAIQPSTIGDDMGCFGTSCSASQFKLGGETWADVEGNSYREEVPWAMDRTFAYLDERGDFESYCYRELLYSTCESWADQHWKVWERELNGNQTSNVLAFVEDDPSAYNNAFNNVINSLAADPTDPASAVSPVGNQSTAPQEWNQQNSGTRNRIVSPVTPDGVAPNDWYQGRAWAVDSTNTYAVGSIARQVSNENGEQHSSKASIWKNNESPVQIGWASNVPEKDGELIAQGSLRDIVVKDGKIYAVGYNTYRDDNYYNASIFVANVADYDDVDAWDSNEIDNVQSKIDGDFIHSNSVASAINDNLVVVGTAKLSGSKPQNGAAGNKIFVVDDASSSSPKASFLSGGIFFDGAGGKVGAINNYNEIVGQLDAEDTRENDGKPRRKRGFIYPYNVDTDRSAIIGNQAQFLDNLTNGGSYSDSNNEYRIIDATDINDAGVISGTAIKCEGGYDDTTHNSYCGGGSQTETMVAVKLIPIQGASNSDIEPRGIDDPVVERSGGSLSWLMLSVLGLLGFRRK
ncbi:DUF3466 family protein [Vibrio paucivorans]|uniref:DUF3466 family protein n=1 Tax=Vibrio paucivorans TaxID=2829489 RepID=A0A9X3CDS3_9VIBR|nr:DUF3466 family protein [Vibrio paucivorans]MCW8333779.1 DUF3466 family protein [Vibrio paucivorans]